jgi:copper homeostasis protein (lipoprotein)
LILLCVGAAFFLFACQGVDHRRESSTQETTPGKAVIAPAGLKLPATFKGTLPCADCEGIRYHLDLWPDGVFHLRQTYLGTPLVADDRGRWHRDPSRAAILLYGRSEKPIQFEVKGPYMIRLLDQQGLTIRSSLPYELTSDGTLTPTDLSLTLNGMFRYMADAARFEDCLTGRSYPVAMEGDYLRLERAYTETAKLEPGAPLMARFEGNITRRPAMEGAGLIPTVVVSRFIGVFPGQRCEQR